MNGRVLISVTTEMETMNKCVKKASGIKKHFVPSIIKTEIENYHRRPSRMLISRMNNKSQSSLSQANMYTRNSTSLGLAYIY